MTAMIILSILLAVAFTAIAIRIEHGLPDSISALVYYLPRPMQWLWTLWMWSVAMLTCIPLIGAMPDEWRSLAFIALGCLMLCGAMPISDSNVSKTAHDVFGTLGGIVSQVCVPFVSPWWLMAWLLWPFLMGSTVVQPEGGDMRRLFKGKGVFVAEYVCFVPLVGALLQYYLFTH